MADSRLYHALQKELSRVEARIAELRGKLVPVQPDCALGRDPRVELMVGQGVYQKLLQQQLDRQAALSTAIARSKTHADRCSQCGEAVELERRLAVPETPFCSRCARAYELSSTRSE